MKRARFWRNLLLFSALSGSTTLSHGYAQEGVVRIRRTSQPSTGNRSDEPAGAEGNVPLAASPYLPLDAGYNFDQPLPPPLPPAYDTLRNSRRETIGPRFDFGTFLDDRVGVDGGDTYFNFLLPLLSSDQEVIFVDARGLVTNQQGRGGATAGWGYRAFHPELNRIIGFSGWVDYDSGHQRTYQQAGVSFESLGTWIDLRVNGYIPFGRESHEVGRVNVGSPFFGGSNLLINQQISNESAYHGVDAEIGGPLPILGRYGINGYVGGYWLDSQTDVRAAGPRVRFEANVTDGFRVGVTATNDNLFGTTAWVNFNMTLPDGRPHQWFRPVDVQDKLLWPVNRSYRVQTHTRVDILPTPVLSLAGGTPNQAQGGAAGSPVNVIFVDPDRTVNGDGSFERPFNTLAGFANTANTTLIIMDGSANSRAVFGNLTLFDDQKLLSTSILAAGGVTLNTNLGLITLPSLTGFGDPTPVSPIFSSPTGGNIVTLAGSRTEIAGITFDGATNNPAVPNATAIAGSNFNNFNIHHNAFRNYSDGLVLNNVRGTGLFQANTLTGLPGTSNDGFRLTNSGVGTLNLFIDAATPPAGSTAAATANTISGNDGAGIRITARNRAEINAHIVGNTVQTNGDGIVLDASATRGTIHASVINNLIDGNRGEDRNLNGILDPGEDRDGDGLLTKGNGVVLMSNAGTLDAATVGEDINQNGRLDLSEDLNGNGAIDTEDVNGNGILDLSEDVNGNGLLDTGEDSNGNGVLDLSEDVNGNGLLDTEDRNGNGVLDLSEDLNNNGLLDGGYIITGNLITRNTGDGIHVVGTNNSNINLVLTRNGFGSLLDRTAGNGGRGLSIAADSGRVNANIGFLNNEDINFNGILDTEDTNGNGRLDPGEDANGNGLLDTEDVNGNRVLDAALLTDGNFFIGNTGGGILADLTGSALGNIVVLSNVVGTGDGNLTFTIPGTINDFYSFSNSSQRGINLTGWTWDLAPVGAAFNTAGIPFTVAIADINATTLQTVSGDAGTLAPSGTALNYAVATGSTLVDLRFLGMNSTNGILDTGEDVNANTRLELLEDRPLSLPFQVDTTIGAAQVALGSQFINTRVVATFATGHTLTGTLQAIPGNPQGTMFVPTTTSSSIVTGPGIELRASGAAIFNNPTIVQNDIRFQGGSGILATATEDGQFRNLLIQDNIIQNNGGTASGGGINLNTINAATAAITGTIQNNLINNNVGPGISLTADTGLIDISQINNNSLVGNTNAISLTTLNNGTITTRVTGNAMDNSTATGFVAIANSGSITLNQFTANSISNGGADGIRWEANNGGTFTLTASEDANGNNILDAGEDANGNGLLDLGLFNRTTTEDSNGNGILDGTEDINNNGVLDPGEDRNGNGIIDTTEDLNNNGILDTAALSNTLTNNAGSGLFVTGTGGNFNLGTVSGLSVSRLARGTGGITIDVTDSLLTGQFIGNQLVGTAVATNPNIGQGFSLTATNGTFDIALGGPNLLDRNVIQNNRGAGVSILAQNTAVGSFRIENNLITGTADDANAATPVSGQGIFVGIQSRGVLTPSTAVLNNSSILNNTIGDATVPTTPASRALGNAGGGILISMNEQSRLNGINIEGNIIGNNGPNAPGAFAANATNIVNGLTFVRNADAVIDAATIANNQIVGNTFDGIYLHTLGGLGDVADFTVVGNTISNNSFDGINLRTEGDSFMDVRITGNTIASNGFDGIVMTSFVNSPLNEQETLTGVWTKNTIQNNGAHGIAISAVPGISAFASPTGSAQPLIIGQNGVDPADGVSLGNVISGNGMGAIEINALGDLEIHNNLITGNGAVATALGFTDANGTGGIDINPLNIGELRLRMTNNIVRGNTGDGLEMVATTGQIASVTLLGNTFDANTLRGIDVLTTGDGTTNLRLGDGSSLGGNVISNNLLEGFYVVNTSAVAQSQAVLSTVPLVATGTVLAIPDTVLDVRGNSIFGNNNGGLFTGGGIVLRAGTTILGTVTARVNGNSLSGNLGDDVFIDTFTSTVAPAANAPIPLANVNLVFQGNIGDSLNVNNANAFYGAVPASLLQLENNFDTVGFLTGGFNFPPWNLVPAGTFTPVFINTNFP